MKTSLVAEIISLMETGEMDSTVGHYEFEKVIGKGNFAVVKLATHIITNVKVSSLA